MKKLSLYIFLVLLFCGNTIADSKDRDVKLNQLFKQLKKSNNVFVHSSAAQAANLELNEGDALTFDVENGEKGPSAVNLQKA